MTNLAHPAGALSPVQWALWITYLAAALILPLYHVRPIVQYLRGNAGIGDACIRNEAIQCLCRIPALLFSVFVAPSLPLFLSIFLDLLGRVGRVFAMRASHSRWLRAQATCPGHGRVTAADKACGSSIADRSTLHHHEEDSR